MATRRRDAMVGKEKKTIPSLSPLHSTKTSMASAAPVNPKLRLAARADISNKTSTVDKTKAPLERKALSLPPTLKTLTAPKTTRVSTNPPSRPSSLSSKIVASQKPAQEINKNVKAPVRQAGSTAVNRSVRPVGIAKPKQGSQNTTSVANLKQGSRTKSVPGVNTKKQGSLNTNLAMKGRSSSVPPPKKLGHKNVSEVNCPDPEFFLDEINDSMVEDLRSNDGLDFEENGFSIEIVGDIDAPVDVKTEMVEEKQCIEEAGHEECELEKHTTDEVKSVSDDANGVMDKINEFGEQIEEKQQEPEQEMVEEKVQESDSEVAVSEQEIDEEEKQESDNESTKQEIIEEKKREPAESALRLPVQQMKKGGSPVSNDVIEETAIKL